MSHSDKLQALADILFAESGGENATPRDRKDAVFQSIASFLSCLSEDLEQDGGAAALEGLRGCIAGDLQVKGRLGRPAKMLTQANVVMYVGQAKRRVGVGHAYMAADYSWNVEMDAMPVGGKFRLEPYDDKEHIP